MPSRPRAVRREDSSRPNVFGESASSLAKHYGDERCTTAADTKQQPGRHRTPGVCWTICHEARKSDAASSPVRVVPTNTTSTTARTYQFIRATPTRTRGAPNVSTLGVCNGVRPLGPYLQPPPAPLPHYDQCCSAEATDLISDK